MKDIRHAIGKDKLLTIATQAGAKYYNLKAVEPYVGLCQYHDIRYGGIS